MYRTIPDHFQAVLGTSVLAERRVAMELNKDWRPAHNPPIPKCQGDIVPVLSIVSGHGTYRDGPYLSNILHPCSCYAGIATCFDWFNNPDNIFQDWLTKMQKGSDRAHAMVFAGTQVLAPRKRPHEKDQFWSPVLEVFPVAGWMRVYMVSTLVTRFSHEYSLPIIVP